MFGFFVVVVCCCCCFCYQWFSVLFMLYSLIQFSPLTDGVVGGDMRDNSTEIFFQSFSAGGPCEQFRHGQGCPLFDVVHPAFPLPTTASPTLQGAMKDGFGEAVVACDMPEPCKCSSLGSCQKRFLWTHLDSKAWILSSESASRVLVLQPLRKIEVTRDW